MNCYVFKYDDHFELCVQETVDQTRLIHEDFRLTADELRFLQKQVHQALTATTENDEHEIPNLPR